MPMRRLPFFYHIELKSINIKNYDQIAFFGWSDNIGVQSDTALFPCSSPAAKKIIRKCLLLKASAA